MADPFVIETTDLRKSYGSHDALTGLTLAVPGGSIYGFLGRNGAGKTTTIKVLLGMVRPTGGTARVFGLPSDAQPSSVEIRRRTGFVSEDKDLFDQMTVDEIVRFTASFYPRWRRDLEDRYRRSFDLPPDRQVKALSRGTRTKLALLLALCRGAELLILDEPTAGLDPAATEEVLQALVSHVAREAMTVFFSSHQIAEVEQIADHVAIIDRGQAVVTGSLDDLRERYRRVQIVFDGEAPSAPLHLPGIVRVRREGRVITVLSNTGDGVVDHVRALGPFDSAQRKPVSVSSEAVTLKDIFLETVVTKE